MTNEEAKILRQELGSIRHLAEFGQSYDMRRLATAVARVVEALSGVSKENTGTPAVPAPEKAA